MERAEAAAAAEATEERAVARAAEATAERAERAAARAAAARAAAARVAAGWVGSAGWAAVASVRVAHSARSRSRRRIGCWRSRARRPNNLCEWGSIRGTRCCRATVVVAAAAPRRPGCKLQAARRVAGRRSGCGREVRR